MVVWLGPRVTNSLYVGSALDDVVPDVYEQFAVYVSDEAPFESVQSV